MDNFSMMRRFFICFWLIVLLVLTQSAMAAEKFGGIGVQVVPLSTGDLSVLHVIAGLPAEQGGLLPGDVIIAVGGLKMQGSDFDLVTKKYLWGKVGTSVTLEWLRPGVAGQFQATMMRVELTKDLQVKSIPGVNISSPK